MGIRQSVKSAIIGKLEGFREWRCYRHYSGQFRRYCETQGIADVPAEGEEAYVRKWSVFTPRVERWSYRLFSRYMGADADIIPEDIGHTCIEDNLNPPRYRDYYSDKNAFDDLFREGTMPATVLRRVGGSVIMDAGWHTVNDFGEIDITALTVYRRLVLKPSVDSCSGAGVMLFEKAGNNFVAKKEKVRLTTDFLLSYGEDFILQEAVEQHPDLARFNLTSVNTLRLLTYRSVKDERVHTVAGILRVGRGGEVCDNAHMGGRIVGIDLRTGELGKYVCDQYGNRSDSWNGVDFRTSRYLVPQWGEALKFAEYVSGRVRHHRLIQLDVTIDRDGNPRLIEFNVGACGFWLYMFCGQKCLGDYTDEVIDYCLERKDRHRHLFLV